VSHAQGRHLQLIPSTDRAPEPVTVDGRNLLRRLGRIDLASVDMAVWLHLSLREVAGSGEGARGTGGRFNPPNSFPVVYGTLARETAGAELTRLAYRNSIAIGSSLPRHVYRCRLRSTKVIDLRQPLVAASLGFSETESVEAARHVTQLIGEMAHALGFEAIIAPSVTGSGDMIAIFPEYVHRSTLDIRHIELWALPSDVPGNDDERWDPALVEVGH
jgi:RES domain-containing protein